MYSELYSTYNTTYICAYNNYTVPFETDEGTRVHLPEEDGDPLSEYINANYIRV